MTILPTHLCNFKCPYCFETRRSEVIEEKIDDKICAVVDDLLHRDIHCLSVNWFGGEPLLEIGTIERLTSKLRKLCASKNISYLASITTNGYLLSYDIYKRLKKCNVLEYVVTLDGLPLYHNKNRMLKNGDGTFDEIINNLKTIKNRDKSKIIKFVIRTNYTAESIIARDQWETLLYSEFLNDERFVYLPRYAWNNPQSTFNPDKLIKFGFDDNISIIDDVHISSELKETPTVELSKDHFKLTRKTLREMFSGSLICAAGMESSIIIDACGQLHKCQVVLDKEINDFGNVDYVNKEKLHTWCNRENDIQWDSCVNCSVFPLCRGVGCPAKTINPVFRENEWCLPLKKYLEKLLWIMSFDNECYQDRIVVRDIN